MGNTETEYEPLFTKTDNKLSTTVTIDHIDVDFYVPSSPLIEENSSRTFLDKESVLQTDQAKQIFSEMLDLTPDTAVALLAAMRRYKISQVAYNAILSKIPPTPHFRDIITKCDMLQRAWTSLLAV